MKTKQSQPPGFLLRLQWRPRGGGVKTLLRLLCAPYLLPQLVLLDELLELLGQLHVLLPQLGVVRAVLLHLHLDVAQGHLEVQHGLLSLLLVLTGPLAVFLLGGTDGGKWHHVSREVLRLEALLLSGSHAFGPSPSCWNPWTEATIFGLRRRA